MSRAVVCAVLVAACAAPVEVEKLPKLPEPTANAIVAEMLATYANAKTYRDGGLASMVLTQGTVKVEPAALTFHTTFERPRLRFDYVARDPKHVMSIWTDGTNVRRESGFTPGRVDEYSDLRSGLALDGPSEVSVLVTPLLTSPSLSLLHELDSPMLTGTEVIDHEPCWRVDASAGKDRFRLWIDKHAHVLRQVVIRSHHDLPDGAIDVVETITYAPVLDGPVAVVPIDAANKTVVDNRNPTWIGVRFDGTTTRVAQVIAKGPAERAGVANGDEIAAVNGDAVTKSSDVVERVRGTKPGSRIALSVQRHGAPVDIAVAAEVMPDVDKLTHDALIDRPAPDFSLPVVNAIGSATLADLAKDVVVVDFWATWCKPCEMARPHLNELQAKHAGKLHVVGISNEDLKDITDYVAAHDMKFTVAHDPDGKVWASYIVGGLPTTVVIAKGKIRYVGVGVDDASLDDAVAKALAL